MFICSVKPENKNRKKLYIECDLKDTKKEKKKTTIEQQNNFSYLCSSQSYE